MGGIGVTSSGTITSDTCKRLTRDGAVHNVDFAVPLIPLESIESRGGLVTCKHVFLIVWTGGYRCRLVDQCLRVIRCLLGSMYNVNKGV